MRLLSLDYDPVYGDDATYAQFSGDDSVFDYDVVIWDPAATFRTYQSGYEESYKNLPSFSENKSVQIKADVARRRNEFKDFVNSGRTLIAIVRPPQGCYVDTSERQYSGTGKNQKTTRIVAQFDLLSALPIGGETRFTAASGSRIDFIGDGPLVRFMRKYSDRLGYEAVLSNAPGTLLAHVTGTDRHVASVVRTKGGGHLVLLPPVDLVREYDEGEESDEEDDGYVEDAPEFQADLLAAIEQLAGSVVTARPAWAAHFSTAKQTELRGAVATQQKRIETARAKLTRLQQEHDEAEARDQLFLGTGRALELEVRSVLELLDGTVTEPEPGRDDWKVAFPEGKAVVEVKGVGKSAAEKHAAQLEKWVAGELEETGEAPKGILVVNTWRETALDKRTGEDFPNQMLKYCESRNHCLVSGLQLFVIREEVEADSKRAEFWRKKLMGTAGILPGASDWSKYLKKVEAAE